MVSIAWDYENQKFKIWEITQCTITD